MRETDSNKGEIDSKKWTNFYTELFKLSNSQEYSLMIENCIGKKAESNEFMYFSRVFDYVSHVILERKASQLKGSSEKVNSFTSDSAGLGKLRYICGCCIAKSKFHFITLGRNNLFKDKKWTFVSSSFLKVKILDHFTTTYEKLLQCSQYQETLHETHRKQNISQSLTNIKDDVLEFFMETDRVSCRIQTESSFHIHGSNILNLVFDELLNCEDLFKRFQSLLTNFDLDVTYLRVDKELADLSIKELFSDLIWRFCRISNDQFRKDMLRTLKKQKSDSLRKRVIEVPKDARMTQLSMSYIIKDNSVDKKSSHLKLQSLIF